MIDENCLGWGEMDWQRAQELLITLADGVDPLTGEVLPDSCICNRPEIVRALYCLLHQMPVRNRPANAGKLWSRAEEKELLREFDLATNQTAIAKKHGRTRGAIEARLAKLGKIKKTFYWEKSE